MREIKFRGKRVDNNEWVYGFLLIQYGESSQYSELAYHISLTQDDNSILQFEVKPETVGELVCKIDKQEIYTGDILKAYRRDDGAKKTPRTDIVTFLNGCFMAFNCTWHELYRLWQSDLEVIGNATDNPDLFVK